MTTETLIRSINDGADEVRKETATAASHLRDHPLRPFVQLLTALIDSPSYVHAATRLLPTLEDAPDEVNGLVLKASQRFPGVFGNDVVDIHIRTAGDARYINKVVVRGPAQCQDHTRRAVLLDVLDLLPELGVYGINVAIRESERIQLGAHDEP